MARLWLLRNRETKKGIARIITAQSFKEIAYHCRELAKGEEVTAENVFVNPKNAGKLSMDYLVHRLSTANQLDIPIEGVDRVEDAIGSSISSMHFSGDKQADQGAWTRVRLLERILSIAHETAARHGLGALEEAA